MEPLRTDAGPSNDHRFDLPPVTRGMFLLAFGGILNIVVVSFGIRDILGSPLFVALIGATLLLLLLYVLGTNVKANGLLGWLGTVPYIGVVLVNGVLAVSGIIALAQPDALGQRGFAAAVRAPRAQLNAVADNFTATERALAQLVVQSDARAATESSSGGTCGPTAPGRGPVYRVRMHDKAMLGEISRSFALRAQTIRTARAQMDAAIAGYRVANHGAVIRKLEAELQAGLAAAQDPALGAMRAQLATRLAGISATTPDPETGIGVRCPDMDLARALGAVLAIRPVAIESPGPMPTTPSHRAAALAFLSESWAALQGAPFDWAMWGGALSIAFFPDILFLYGLAQHQKDQRTRLGIVGLLARAISKTGTDWSAAATAAAQGARDPSVRLLSQYHAVRSRLIGDVHFLVIPAGADAQDRAVYFIGLGLVEIGKARYAGLAPAGLLPKAAVPRPAHPALESHFFVLKRGVWRSLLVEAMRGAPPPEGAPPTGADSSWQEAA